MIIKKNKAIIFILCVINLLASFLCMHMSSLFYSIFLIVCILGSLYKVLAPSLLVGFGLNIIELLMPKRYVRYTDTSVSAINRIFILLFIVLLVSIILKKKKIAITSMAITCALAVIKYFVFRGSGVGTSYFGSVFLSYKGSGGFILYVLMLLIICSSVFVDYKIAEKNETLKGETSSSNIEEKLVELNRMYESGEIDLDTYEANRKDILKEFI